MGSKFSLPQQSAQMKTGGTEPASTYPNYRSSLKDVRAADSASQIASSSPRTLADDYLRSRQQSFNVSTSAPAATAPSVSVPPMKTTQVTPNRVNPLNRNQRIASRLEEDVDRYNEYRSGGMNAGQARGRMMADAAVSGISTQRLECLAHRSEHCLPTG